MNLETYRVFSDALDKHLSWAFTNNAVRTHDEWDKLKAKDLSKRLKQAGLTINKNK